MAQNSLVTVHSRGQKRLCQASQQNQPILPIPHLHFVHHCISPMGKLPELTGQILSGQNMEWERGSDDNACP